MKNPPEKGIEKKSRKKRTRLKNISEIGYGNKAQIGKTCCLPFTYNLPVHLCSVYLFMLCSTCREEQRS